MIRLAEDKDTDQLVKLMLAFASESSVAGYGPDEFNIPHLKTVLKAVRDNGRVWVAERDQQIVGYLMCLVEMDIWNPKVKRLRELLWYVDPEYRDTTIGGRLFATYCRYGDQLLKSKQIAGYSISLLDSSPDLELAERGWRAVETHWIKEQ